MDGYITLCGKGYGEYEEKHSRFLAAAVPCKSEEEAASIIAAYRKKYFDARHNVYAYVLRDNTARFSDDGEPHATAGKPVLDIIKGSGIVDILVIVTRYFGGTLLGTGGLVRAYSASAKKALENAELCEMSLCTVLKTECSYSDYNLLLPMLSSYECEIAGTDFSDIITVTFAVRNEKLDRFEADFCEKFASRLKLNQIRQEFFALKIKK